MALLQILLITQFQILQVLKSDFMDEPSLNPEGTIYNVASTRRTGSQLIIQINVEGSTRSTFRINRKTLRLSGNRAGICKIVGKDLTF